MNRKAVPESLDYFNCNRPGKRLPVRIRSESFSDTLQIRHQPILRSSSVHGKRPSDTSILGVNKLDYDSPRLDSRGEPHLQLFQSPAQVAADHVELFCEASPDLRQG